MIADVPVTCLSDGREYISAGGWHVWYCDKHRPSAEHYTLIEEASNG